MSPKKLPLIFTLGLILLLLTSCTATKRSKSTAASLDGTWKPIRQEMAGKELPTAFYENQKLVLKDSTYHMEAESIDNGIVRVNGNKMDIYSMEGVNKGAHLTAIYKLEGDQLTICYDLEGGNYPESFETVGKPLYFISVFNKE